MGSFLIHLALFYSSCIVLVNTFIMSSGPRNVVKILGPTLISQFGDWGRPEFCAHGAYATGYKIKIEPVQHGGDDTSLNAIELNCTIIDGNYFGGTVSSTEGLFGAWSREETCPGNTFLTSFRLQVEGDQHGGDDTAANYIQFQCRDFAGQTGKSTPLSVGLGHGFWGGFSGWFDCPQDSAVCGIQTRVEDDQHGGDDTSLNDVRLFCCK